MCACAPEQGFEEAVAVWGLCVRGSVGLAAQNSRFGLRPAVLCCSEGQQHLRMWGCKSCNEISGTGQGPQAAGYRFPFSFPGVVFPRNVAVQFEKGNAKEVFLGWSSLGWQQKSDCSAPLLYLKSTMESEWLCWDAFSKNIFLSFHDVRTLMSYSEAVGKWGTAQLLLFVKWHITGEGEGSRKLKYQSELMVFLKFSVTCCWLLLFVNTMVLLLQ